MSNKEKALQLLDQIPDYKVEYLIAYMQGMIAGEEIPNAETIAAMQELKNGGGECFNTLDELWQSLED